MNNLISRLRMRLAVGVALGAIVAGHLTVGLLGQTATKLFTYSSTIGSLTSGGSATGQLWYPVGLAVGPLDRIYVADTGNDRVQIFDANGSFFGGFGTTGEVPSDGNGEEIVDVTPDPPFEFNYPSGIVVDQNGKILVVESDNHRMQLFETNPADATGKTFQIVKSFGGHGNYDTLDPVNLHPDTGNYIGPASTLTGLNYPTRAAIWPGTKLNDPNDTAGRVALVDSGNHRVIVLDSMLNPLFSFGTCIGACNAPGNMEVPWGVGMDLTHIYVADWANHRTETYTLTGQYLSGFGSIGAQNSPGATERPFDAQPDGLGHLIIADRNRSRVLFLTPDQTTTRVACSSAEATRCSITATDGTKYEALVVGGFTTTGQELGKFSHPQAVAMDSEGRLLVLDTEGHRVVIFRVAQIGIANVSVTDGPVQSGQTVTLSVKVKNFGVDPITVAPLVTANLAGVLTTPAAVSVAGGASTTFTLPFVSNASGQLSFTVRASGTPQIGDPIFSPTVASGAVTVTPTPGPKLSVSVAAPERVGTGTPFAVQLTVANNGTSELTAVQPFIDLPIGSVLSVTTAPAVDAVPLAPGATRLYTFTLTASAAGTPVLTGRATANYQDLALPGGIGVVGPLGILPTASVIVDNDVTPPVTTDTVLTTKAPSGWYLTPVQVTLSATDNKQVALIQYSVTGLVGFSGQSTNPIKTVTVPYDGGNDFTYFAKDVAGNTEAPHSLHFDIDTVPPTITKGGVTPGPNAAGWITPYPTIRFDATDFGSGVAFVTDDVTVTTDKVGIDVPGTARDVAGHESTTKVTVNVDTKAPTIVCAPTVAATGLNGWYKAGTASVTVKCDAVDQPLLSGIEYVRAICPAASGGIVTATSSLTPTSLKFGPTTSSASCTISAEGVHTVYGETSDVAGNKTPAQAITIKIDRTAPTVTCGTASGGDIWPPNHKMILWDVFVNVTDTPPPGLIGPSTAGFRLVNYSSSEALNWLGDGNTSVYTKDMTGWVKNFMVQVPTAGVTSGYVRSERSGLGTGRIYRLKYEGLDLAGNVTSCTSVLTEVPHDQGKK